MAWTTRRPTPNRKQRGRAGSQQAPEVRTHRDRVRDAIWAMGGERCAQWPPLLVTDQPDATAVVPPNHLDSPLQPVKRAVRRPASGENAAQLRPVANPPQPCRDDSKRLIAGEETRHEHDETTVAARHADAVQEGRPAGGRVRATLESRPAGGPSSASGPARHEAVGLLEADTVPARRRDRAFSYRVRSRAPLRSLCAFGFPAPSVPASAGPRAPRALCGSQATSCRA